jgi:4-diphosphocytidyl-2-C-methyl-D-erythritol kinase
MISYPNAKINLGLHVINKRDDGFHNIETIFYPIGFSDILECIENKAYAKHNKCVLVQHGLSISGNIDTNLVLRAYKLLDEKFDLPPVLVHLNKLLPMGAGLGGGSSDAAYMLKMLNELFGLNLTITALENFASLLGSDCPFFIQNKPAYLFGKGQELVPFDLSLAGKYLVLVNTGAHSNTALAYKYAKRREVFNAEQSLKKLIKLPIESWKENLVNDFELSVFESIPKLKEVKSWFYKQGATYASMSGSGATMFGLFDEIPKLNGIWSKYVVYKDCLL